MTDVVRRTWRWLARIDVAAILLTLAIVLMAAGSLFPQWTGAAAADKMRWEALIRDRYGGLAGLLTALGAFRFFRSPLVGGLLVVLILTTLACTLNRWPALWRSAWRHPGRPPDALLDSAPHIAYFAASPSADLPDRVRRCLRGHGFQSFQKPVATTSTSAATVTPLPAWPPSSTIWPCSCCSSAR